MKRVTIEEASKLILQNVSEVSFERLPVTECLGRILSKDIYTAMDQPPFPRSSMDGYAVHAEDIAGATVEKPVVLKVAGHQYAGDAPFGFLERGHALRIMTGAVIPDGADCVVKQEDTDYGEEQVQIFNAIKAWDNYCPVGEDFGAGELLAEAGTTVDAYLIAAAVAAGVDHLEVRRKVRAAVITTGDELQMPGEPLKPGKIYNSNLALFTARLTALGCDVVMAISAGDDLDKISSAIRTAAGKISETTGITDSTSTDEGAGIANTVCKTETEAILVAPRDCDLIVTTGGVSVGQKDLIPEVMEQLGADTLFHGVAVKPGMPTMFSLLKEKRISVLSLSGNPYSAAAVFELFVQPMLSRMTGSKKPVLKPVKGISQDTFRQGTKGMPRFLRGYYEDGRLWFSKQQHNGQTKAGIGTNCLICMEAGRGPVAKGDELTAYLT